MVPRGIRNCNPTSIVRSNSRWLGKVTPSRDPIFETFSTPQYGIEAAFKLLRTYYIKYNLTTVNWLIRRWSATDQTAYVKNVADAVGVKPDDYIPFEKFVFIRMVTAMILQENGQQPYSAGLIDRASRVVFKGL